MGMSVGSSQGGQRRGRRGTPRYSAMATINMTPFIDVVLVLLIIFMVAAPMMASGIVTDLPETKAGGLPSTAAPLTVEIKDKGEIFIDGKSAALETLIPKIQELAKNGVDERIYLRSSKIVNYGRVAEVMASLTNAGFKKVALVTIDPGRM